MTNTVAKRFSVLIPDAESHRTLDVLRALAFAGDGPIDLVSADRNVRARFSRHVRMFRHVPETPDGRAWVDAVADVVRRVGPDVLLPVNVRGIGLVNRFRSELSTLVSIPPLPSDEMVSVLSDKWTLYERARACGIAVPTTIPGSSAAFRERGSDLRFPVLLKPRTGSGGGEGILRFDSSDDLLRHLETREASGSARSCVIQNYEEGTDMGCSVLCREGAILAATTQRGVFSIPFFGPVDAVDVTRLPPLLDVATRLCSATTWNGIANMDFVLPRGHSAPKLLEVNPRFWGSLAASVLAGVNFPHLACLAAVREQFPQPVARDYSFVRASTLLSRERRSRLPASFREGLRLRNTSFYFSLLDPMPGILHLLSRRQD